MREGRIRMIKRLKAGIINIRGAGDSEPLMLVFLVKRRRTKGYNGIDIY